MSEIFNLANYSYNFHALPYLIFGSLTLFFGLFVLLAHPRSSVNVGYFLFCFFSFIWMFFNGISKLSDNLEVFSFWFKIGKSIGVPFIASAIHYFSVVWSEDRHQKKLILPFFLIMLPFAVLFWIPNGMVEKIWLVGNFFGYPFYYGLGRFHPPYALLYVVWWSIVVSFGIFNLYQIGRANNLSLIERKRRKFIFYLFSLALIASVEWLPFFGVKIFPFGSIIFLLIVIGLAFYGILKYQLMDIRLIIKRAFFYSLGIALISGFITAITFLSSWFVQVIPGFQFWTVPLFAGIVTFFIGNIFWRQSKKVEKAYVIEKQARQELEHLSEVKDQFLLTTQHHLRTPLTIMKGYLSALLAKKQELDLKTREDYTEKTLNSTNRLIKLVNELLDISELQVGKKPLHLQPTNIKNLIEDILQDLQGEIQTKKLKVKISQADWPLIPADQEKLRIALSNILDNAVKYTPQGEIIIQGQLAPSSAEGKTKDSFQISIQDTGIGINPEEIKTLFTRYFERGEQAQKMYATGRGIGLFIAANIIKAHQGRIWAESEGPGKGTRFKIELLI